VLNRLRNCKHTTVCELTSNYDVHYHSILSLPLDKCNGKDPHRYIKDIFRSEFGFTCVKQVTEYEIWTQYLMKDIKETSKVIAGAILKDDYEIFNVFE
jgi:hypothetical protein